MKRILILLLSAVALSLTVAATGAERVRLPSMGDPAEQYLSQSQERELGRQLMREIRQRLPLEEDPEINAYVRDLEQRLVTHSDAPGQEFHFFVVDHPSINAFAMPGGYIGVNTGLILAARAESELAGVLAHEIAHVTQRHIARRFGEAQRINLRTTAIILASIIIGSQDPQAGSAAAMAGMAGSVQQQLNFSREHEHEADRIGVRMLAEAGLDPMGMPRFFERLHTASQYRSQPPEWLSTHPLTAARVSDTHSRAQAMSNRGEVFESAGFGFAQARVKLLSSRTPQDAAAFFKGALNDSDGAPPLRYGLALALTASGAHAQARELLTGLLDEVGEDASLLLAMAELELASGNLQAALEQFQEAASLYPQNAAIRQRHAEALLDAGRPEQARQLLSRSQNQAEAAPRMYWLLAQAASASGRDAEARLAMAEHYYFEGDLQPALNQLNQVMQSASADPHQVARASARADQVRSEIRQRQAGP